MQSHAVYSVAYVKTLERSFKALVFLVGVLIPVSLYVLMVKDTSPAEAQQKAFAKASIEERIAAILKAKQESQVRMFIREANPALSWGKVEKIARLEQKYAEKYDVPLHIGLAITWKESTFRPNAVSPTGPVGAKQVAFSWWAVECGVTSKAQLLAVDKNIECGYHAIAKYKKQYSTWQKALAMYHGHPTDFQLNQKYALTVLEKARKIQTLITT